MIFKGTIFVLLLIFAFAVASSYYVNKEGFDDISEMKLNSLVKAMNTVSTASTASTAPTAPTAPTASDASDTSVTPSRTDIIPEISVSGSGYAAMTLQQRAELIKDIQKIVRNEILANRSTTPVSPSTSTTALTATTSTASTTNNSQTSNTNSTAQGSEYENSCYKDTEYRCPKNPDGSCPPMPDMSQYIKKDAIPCWNCSLDY